MFSAFQNMKEKYVKKIQGYGFPTKQGIEDEKEFVKGHFPDLAIKAWV